MNRRERRGGMQPSGTHTGHRPEASGTYRWGGSHMTKFLLELGMGLRELPLRYCASDTARASSSLTPSRRAQSCR
jgi:hypothetical protein